jgi:hypothetical protein
MNEEMAVHSVSEEEAESTTNLCQEVAIDDVFKIVCDHQNQLRWE